MNIGYVFVFRGFGFFFRKEVNVFG